MTATDRRGARALQIGIGLAISAALVWYTFRGTDWASVWTTVRHVKLAPLLLAIVLATLPFPLRVPRWRLLLRHDDDSALATAPLWHAIAMGFAANNVLPLRAGELLRVAAVSRLGRVSFPTALSSLAVERVLDALAVLGLMGIGLLLADFPPGTVSSAAALTTGAVCLAALMMAIVAAWQRALALRLLERILPDNAVGAKIHHFVDRLLVGVGALRSWQRSLPVIGWTLVIWLVNAAAFYVAFSAFGFNVPFSGALLLQGTLMIGIAAPQAPGYAGGFELPIFLTLMLYGISKDQGVAYGLTYHISTFVPITILGAWSIVHTKFGLKAAHEVEESAT